MDQNLFMMTQNARSLFASHLSAYELYDQSQRWLDYVSYNHTTIGGIELRLVDQSATGCLA